MVLLKKYAASQCHQFEREWRLSALFNPVYFSDCHTCIDIQVRAQDRVISVSSLSIAYYAHHLQEGVYMLFHTEKIPDEIA